MTTPARLTNGYYRVRSSWDDPKSQIGQYKLLASAVKKADANPGTYVFDDLGVVVYPISPAPTIDTTAAETIPADTTPQEPAPVAVTAATPPEPTSADPTQPEPILYARLNRLMNIRSCPSLAATVIAKKPQGTIVEVARVLDGWYELTDGSFLLADPSLVTTGPATYTAKLGDTLTTIAWENNTTTEVIRELNPGVGTIHAGMVLLMPQGAAEDG